MAITEQEMTLDLSGTGIVFYSSQFTQHIKDGTDFLTQNYTTEQQVQSYIQDGTIVGFSTGSPGQFILRFHEGYPSEEQLRKCEFKLRLGLHAIGGVVCFRDLYDLLKWGKSKGSGVFVADSHEMV